MTAHDSENEYFRKKRLEIDCANTWIIIVSFFLENVTAAGAQFAMWPRGANGVDNFTEIFTQAKDRYWEVCVVRIAFAGFSEIQNQNVPIRSMQMKNIQILGELDAVHEPDGRKTSYEKAIHWFIICTLVLC